MAYSRTNLRLTATFVGSASVYPALGHAFSSPEVGTNCIHLFQQQLVVEDSDSSSLTEAGQNIKGFGLALKTVNQVCNRIGCWQWQLDNRTADNGSLAVLRFVTDN
ncbi:hypothetical protein [Ferrimonas lipolytica]|uniref:Uncharacterized protein n=1 Tax=Ferrimonas lipolytica TaxID=2724191 RepID=A0A6H1UAK9_9GAMM|nr:hypothetical protein [Ferrimonas lipolytica]QIZ75620.1 hypothetical protein HER31_01115 [Ferrimonas lipolytica]